VAEKQTAEETRGKYEQGVIYCFLGTEKDHQETIVDPGAKKRTIDMAQLA